MFRRKYKKPSVCCLAFIWIHFKQSMKNKSFALFLLSFLYLEVLCLGCYFCISWVYFFRPWVILAKMCDFNPIGYCRQDNWVWVHETALSCRKTKAKGQGHHRLGPETGIPHIPQATGTSGATPLPNPHHPEHFQASVPMNLEIDTATKNEDPHTIRGWKTSAWNKEIPLK